MTDYSREVSEEKAMKLLEEHGLQRSDQEYQPPTDQAPLPPVQDPSKLGTRSNRLKHRREEQEKPPQSQKKHKPDKTHTEFTDQDSSFSQKDSVTRTASSSDELCFNLDSDPEDDPGCLQTQLVIACQTSLAASTTPSIAFRIALAISHR